jgi:hypothetical protein
MLAPIFACTIVEQCSFILFVVRWGKTLQVSQKNVATMWRKLYYAKKDVPVSRKVP